MAASIPDNVHSFQHSLNVTEPVVTAPVVDKEPPDISPIQLKLTDEEIEAPGEVIVKLDDQSNPPSNDT